MTPDQAAMVDFLRQQYADGIERARSIGNALITQGALTHLGVSPDKAEARAREGLNAAETRARFLDETVVPYLGTAGPTGRIADTQLRVLAYEHHGAPGYDETWRP
jgi:hypothetical protein